MDHERIYDQLGSLIREARDKAGLTQADLASAISLSRTSVSNIEAGRQRIPVHTLYDISFALGVRLSDLTPPLTLKGELSSKIPENLNNNEREWIESLVSESEAGE